MKCNLKKQSNVFLIAIILVSLFLGGCQTEKTIRYQHAEVYLDCENYSSVQNDPGYCMVITGTSDGLRIQTGMIVTKKEVTKLMQDLGWRKENQTSKYVDVNGSSYLVEIIKFSRELK